MKSSFKPTSAYYRLAVAIVGVVLLVINTIIAPPQEWWGLILVLFIAVQINYPISLALGEISLIHATALGIALLHGSAVAGWTILIGVLLGSLFRQWRAGNFRFRGKAVLSWLFDAGFAVGTQTIPLIAALMLTGWWRGHGSTYDSPWPGALAPLLLFAFFQVLIYLGNHALQLTQRRSLLPRDLIALLILEIAPLPFISLVPVMYITVPIATIFLAQGGIVVIVQLALYYISSTRQELERRLQELSTLDNVSRVLRSTLNLDKLLTVIQEQVTHHLKVECFYVALYDVEGKNIWYPLAVKYGQRYHWPPRALMPDRLTDRVISEGKPIFITPQNRAALMQTDLPASEEMPQAWIGVPLITPERTTGCLAVFSASPQTEFDPADLNLLIILSGQVSVAIQNALLYDQTRRRAAQLETLNRIMALITASLDTKSVLEQVCSSVAEVTNGQRSAIFLLDSEKGQIWLAHAHGFSNDFAQWNENLALGQGSRTRCLRTGRPNLVPDIRTVTIEKNALESLKRENIQSFGDFPLVTPDGQIGILSVYFETAHAFPPEEEELLQTLASQAALAVANARLYTSTDRALARRAEQLSILENIGRELSGAINSSRLFDMILGYALRFTNSPWGSLSLFNPQTQMLEIKAALGYVDYQQAYSVNNGITGRAVKTRQPIYIGAVQNDPDYIDLTKSEARSQLSIPIIHEGRVLGALTLESDQENAYSDNDQAFINQLVVQAAVAVVNAELYNETQRRLREQSILYLISTHLAGNTELDQVLQTIARSMASAVPTASVGIYLWDDHANLYRSAHSAPSTTCSLDQIPALILETDLISLPGGLSEAGIIRFSAEQKEAEPFLGKCQECKIVIFPLVVKRHRLGLIILHLPKEQTIQEDEQQLLNAIIAQISISLQNALLFLDVTHGRDRLAAVLNSVDEGLIMLESSSRILLVNQSVQTITWLAPEDLLGQALPELSDEALNTLGYSRQEAEALAQNMVQEQDFVTPKTTIKITELRPGRVVERSTLPVWGQGGQMIGWMIVLRDVTEEHQIAEARELITETLVHDLRSPVSAVLSALDILESAVPAGQDDELFDQAFRVARGSSQRVLGLIESLLDISRFNAGKIELNLASIGMHSLAEGILAEFIPQANEFGVIIRNEIPPEMPTVSADHSKIARVLYNLVDNAIKYTPAGGAVIVSAQEYDQQPGMIIVRVNDTGPGIPDEYREKIFDRFAQIPGQRGRRRGSGLGLTFSRLAIEAHGGKIWVDNGTEGGSVFTFTLPKAGTPETNKNVFGF